jgi:hypothetical protein
VFILLMGCWTIAATRGGVIGTYSRQVREIAEIE